MALFARKKKEEKKEAKKATPVSQISQSPKNISGNTGDLSGVLRSPRITEKASFHISAGVYTFDVAENATKRSIAQAIAAAYKVQPRKIAIVSIPKKARRNARTGQYGMSRGGKKAYVYLKKGENITIS